MDIPDDETLLASAINFLIEGQEIYEASLLLLCKIETHTWNSYDNATSLTVEVIGSRVVYEIIRNKAAPSNEIIKQAFNAVLPYDYYVEFIRARVGLVSVDSEWRDKVEDILQGKVSLNQCLPIKENPRFFWEHLGFRSPPEIAIAKALNECDLFFLPNCMARFGSSTPTDRQNREADFLVCYNGKWGIIEVDGETVHTNAARDHDRDRLFRAHRIRVIEHFTAKECISDPKGVVQKFLDLLRKNG